MKKKNWLRIVLLLCIVVTGSVVAVHASEIKKAESVKEALEKKKKETQNKIEQLKNEKGDILVYIEKLDTQLLELSAQAEETNAKIKKVNGELKTTKKELKKAEDQEEKQYASMKKRIKYMYENGTTDYISLLLGAESFSDLLNRAEYIAKISEYDNQLLKEYEETKKLIASQKKELEEKKENLSILKEELAYEQGVVNTLIDDKKTELAKYNTNIDAASDEVKAYAEEIEKQEQEIENLLAKERARIAEEERKKKEAEKAAAEAAAAAAAQQSNTNKDTSQNNGGTNTEPEKDYSAGSSDFRWPLNVSGTITSYFGGRDQPTAGASTNHKGIDISVPTGTTIVAAASGTVVTAAYSSSAGNYVMINHGNNIFTVYMHCSTLKVSVGQNVSKGEAIAASGSTGVSTGPHLHFGICINGAYVNPLDYVSP